MNNKVFAIFGRYFLSHLGLAVLLLTEIAACTLLDPPQNITTIYPKVIDGYISNPGIGWQYDQDAVSSAYLPETVAYSIRQQITWKTLNPAEGVLDWTALDAQIAAAAAQGKQFSFRVFTMADSKYGGAFVPDWVWNKGAVITPSGEPDYSNCVYQEEWGNFVNALLQRYDGDPRIAFIDISGYGEFNEWNWGDQTEWDPLWDNSYKNHRAGPLTMQTLDSQSRRRLADMFIGGSFTGHQCRDSNGNIRVVDYSYPGAHRTQLVMPFAGIIQSTQYVFLRRADIGFRYDCLGRASNSLSNLIGDKWKLAPIVFEFCSPDQFNLKVAQNTLYSMHGSLIHNNGYELSAQDLQQLLTNAGYRYVLTEAQFNNIVSEGGQISINMVWQNTGSAPAYPKMGQNFQLHVYLMGKSSNNIAANFPVATDISKWMPATNPTDAAPKNAFSFTLDLPNAVQPGVYELKVSIIDLRTGSPIQLAFQGGNNQGMYTLSDIVVTSK